MITLEELWREYHYAKAATEKLPKWKRKILQMQHDAEVRMGYIRDPRAKEETK